MKSSAYYFHMKTKTLAMWEAAPQKHSLQQGVIKNVGAKHW